MYKLALIPDNTLSIHLTTGNMKSSHSALSVVIYETCVRREPIMSLFYMRCLDQQANIYNTNFRSLVNRLINMQSAQYVQYK